MPRVSLGQCYSQLRRTGVVPFFIFFVTLGTTIFDAARVPTLEEAVCRILASDNCRHDRTARTRLASINGWIEFVTAIQGVFLTLPYAWLADRTNKKALLFIGLVMSTVSMVAFAAICHFAKTASALDSVIFFRVFECVGGGVPMAYVLLNSLLFFRMTAEKRASVFYMMSMVLVVARAGGTALCGVLLDKYPHCVVPVAALVYGINLPLVAFSSTPASQPEGTGESRPDGSPLLSDIDGEQRDKDGSQAANDIYTCLASTYGELRKQPVLSWSLLFYVVKILAIDVQMIQAQWAVARFNWTFSVVAYLNAYTAVVCFLILSGLPFASQHLVSRYGNPHDMEVLILRLSIAFHVIGSVGMGLAFNGAAFVVAISVSALSVGALDTFKAFVSGFYPPQRITELYATISLVETVVHVVSSRMWTSVLVESLDLRGVDMGLPYFVSAGFSLIGYTLIYAMARYNRYGEVS